MRKEKNALEEGAVPALRRAGAGACHVVNTADELQQKQRVSDKSERSVSSISTDVVGELEDSALAGAQAHLRRASVGVGLSASCIRVRARGVGNSGKGGSTAVVDDYIRRCKVRRLTDGLNDAA